MGDDHEVAPCHSAPSQILEESVGIPASCRFQILRPHRPLADRSAHAADTQLSAILDNLVDGSDRAHGLRLTHDGWSKDLTQASVDQNACLRAQLPTYLGGRLHAAKVGRRHDDGNLRAVLGGESSDDLRRLLCCRLKTSITQRWIHRIPAEVLALSPAAALVKSVYAVCSLGVTNYSKDLRLKLPSLPPGHQRSLARAPGST
mmetsp:Transcript_170293/g.546226  ORF Transcript_170293/g.546226 Transcript_170293/m.546226 type:complete len:203 (+) Transcript_170293:2344-2952(+)